MKGKTAVRWFVCVLAAAIGIEAVAADRGGRAEYVGGTIADLPKSGGFIDVTGEQCLRFQAGTASVEVPYESINVLEYGQKVNRRYLLAVTISPFLLLSKSRKHFLTVGYADEQGRQQALVFRVDKDQIRSVIVSLEAKTGRKVEYQDTEARRAGPG
jgi:hypothetical protein